MAPMLRVCFVCLGNICRSPSAEGAMRHLVTEAGLEHAIELDSAGTGAYHAGERPDARARAAGRRRGILIDGRARQVRRADFAQFDHLVAMDSANREDLRRLAPPLARAQISMLRDFDPTATPGSSVPDPYYGGDRDFDEVIELCLSACRGLLHRLRLEHDL